MRASSLSRLALTALCSALLAGCATGPKPLNDGELAVPADYKSWPKFLSAVQRPDAKQVREIYMNPTGAAGSAAAGFGNGTVFVMENYAAKANPDVVTSVIVGNEALLRLAEHPSSLDAPLERDGGESVVDRVADDGVVTSAEIVPFVDWTNIRRVWVLPTRAPVPAQW